MFPDRQTETLIGVRDADGILSWAVYSDCRCSTDSGKVTRVLLTYRDVTDRKKVEAERERLEDELRQSQKFELIGRLAGGVAHDFNNLLTVINGRSDLVLLRLKERDPLREALTKIRKAGGRAADLTRRLLVVSRKQVVALGPVDVNSVIAKSAAMLRSLIGEDVQLVIELDPEAGMARTEQVLVHQVLMNLAVNSRDAMPHGGRLVIRTQSVDLDEAAAAKYSEAKPGSWLLFDVADTGTGLSPEAQQHLFEPFFTTKEPGKGTGLGLSTVHGIVHQSGGWIHVTSEPGSGATFLIGLPRPKAGKPADAPAPQPAPLPRLRDHFGGGGPGGGSANRGGGPEGLWLQRAGGIGRV